ncbi:MAG: hypothetical protein WEB87_02055 [Bacteriovoracaceae bacterium]
MIAAALQTFQDDMKQRKRVISLFLAKERNFLWLVTLALLASGIFYETPQIAMWIGFALAGYSAIANDSIQTLGTFIASNSDKKWWQLWLYVGGIFVVTIISGWIVYNGDVSFQRLTAKGFSEAPKNFQFLQIASPLILLMLTRFRMPVSTTFLLLSCFSANLEGIAKVTVKSLSGYGVAFVTALAVWVLLRKPLEKFSQGVVGMKWTVIQWVVSGALWSIWIMQDAANIAVFLPRTLGAYEVGAFTLYIFFGLGILFYLKGDKIQTIVQEKSQVTHIKAATAIDFVYALILLLFQKMSNIPMSTTWVFIGLLGGREIAFLINNRFEEKKKIFKMVRRDVSSAVIGLIISIMIAMAVNPIIFDEILAKVGYYGV